MKDAYWGGTAGTEQAQEDALQPYGPLGPKRIGKKKGKQSETRHADRGMGGKGSTRNPAISANPIF